MTTRLSAEGLLAFDMEDSRYEYRRKRFVPLPPARDAGCGAA
jgi:hypothetical protein